MIIAIVCLCTRVYVCLYKFTINVEEEEIEEEKLGKNLY